MVRFVTLCVFISVCLSERFVSRVTAELVEGVPCYSQHC